MNICSSPKFFQDFFALNLQALRDTPDAGKGISPGGSRKSCAKICKDIENHLTQDNIDNFFVFLIFVNGSPEP